MAIPLCRVMVSDNEAMFRQTLRTLMDELPDDLFYFEAAAADGPPPFDLDADLLLAADLAAMGAELDHSWTELDA
jgi:hypothetical protein